MTPEQEERDNDEWFLTLPRERKSQVRQWLDRDSLRHASLEAANDPMQPTLDLT